MSKKSFFCLLLFAAWCLVPIDAAWALVLTGTTEIVDCGRDTPTKKMAIELLQKSLKEMFGVQMTIVKEEQHKSNAPALYIGGGRLAAQNGIDIEKLGEEQLVVKALPGGNVLLIGGTRGIYYAVTEFLELAGCRHYSLGARIIPRKDKITLDDGLYVNRSPVFKRRAIYIGRMNQDFYTWNKMNCEYLPAHLEVPQIGTSHTMDALSRDFPDEAFAINEAGKRLRGSSGQPCFSNPEARRLMKKNLRSVIEKTNKERVAKGLPPARIARVTQNDNNVRCQCKECRALVEKYGAESGLLLDFINDVASAFPDMSITTFAYRFTRNPPKAGSIKAAPNVAVEIALQSREWSNGETRYLLLPWMDERNAEARQLLLAWKDFADTLYVSDYGKFFQQAQPVPYTSLEAILANMPFYAANKASHFFLENEFGSRKGGALSTHAFQELEIYATAKLMDNPALDKEALLKDYFSGYYGPAATDMRQYLDYLLECQRKRPPEERAYFATWEYLDAEFFRKSSALLEGALDKVRGNEAYAERVLFELVPLYSSLLVLWPYFEQRHETLPFSRERISGQLKLASEAVSKRYYPNSFEYEKLRMLSLNGGGKITLPPEVEGKPYRVMIPQAGMTADADSCLGLSRKLGAKVSHARKTELGIYDPITRKIVMRKIFAEVPQDEKFHLLKVGSAPITGALPYVFAHWTWRFVFRMGIFTPDLAEQDVDLWVSLKLQGPAYVKGSTKENLFALDYMLLVPKGNKASGKEAD